MEIDDRLLTDANNEDVTITVLGLLFREVNEHLRATDEKRLQLFAGYVGLLALAVSILATRDSANAFTEGASWTQLIAYGVLVLVGCMVVFILDAYRGWKMHYKGVCEKIAFRLGIEDRFLPYWLQRDLFEHEHIFRMSADNALTYFTALMTSILIVVFNVMLRNLVDGFVGTALVICNTVVYVAYLATLRLRVMKRKRKFRSEDDEEKRQRAEEDWRRMEVADTSAVSAS